MISVTHLHAAELLRTDETDALEELSENFEQRWSVYKELDGRAAHPKDSTWLPCPSVVQILSE